MSPKKIKKQTRLRSIIIITFVTTTLITVASIGYFVFSNWYDSTQNLILEMSSNMSDDIYSKIDAFISVPLHINEHNHKMIEEGIIDLENDAERDFFFMNVLLSFNKDALYSFSYGDESGYYYGARRNGDEKIEIMKNNLETAGHSIYYAVNDDLTTGKQVVDAGIFDPRTRAWYEVAKEKETAYFSPVYKHFVMDDLAVSAAHPVYDKNNEFIGVMGTHVTLSKMNDYLREVIGDGESVAYIVDKSGLVVANSLRRNNFISNDSGEVERLKIEDINQKVVAKAFDDYMSLGENDQRVNTEYGKLHIHFTEYDNKGLEWVIVTAIPEELFTDNIFQNMYFTIILTAIALISSIIIYIKITQNYLTPFYELIDVTEKFSRGEFNNRVKFQKDDEVGKLSLAFNKMADSLQLMINTLEERVSERTAELNDNKEQLRLLLDSTAEGIYGIDIEGVCTFCNESCIEFLGYSHQDELIGKDMHTLIHKNRDGSEMNLIECKIRQAAIKGEGIHSNDEVFWKADGTTFEVEYYSYPQKKNGEVVGTVVTFMDITKRKLNENHIEFLSNHDSLTGLYNRMYFENQLKVINHVDNFPISILIGDVDGLKLTNDIFGHSEGDLLIKTAAESFVKICRADDLIARTGGDEFSLVLKQTDIDNAKNIASRIKEEFSNVQFSAFKGSISIGCAVMYNSNQSIIEVMKLAEEHMYIDKTLNSKKLNTDTIKHLISKLHNTSNRELEHSKNVSELSMQIGMKLGLTQDECKRLKEAGYYHDIGKITLDDLLVQNDEVPMDYENEEVKNHVIMGYRILNAFDETTDLAEIILMHHEKWDGSGYPKGLSREDIPLYSRIITVAESYDELTNKYNKVMMDPKEAIEVVKKDGGQSYDPAIVRILEHIVLGQ
ncbi:MAG: diguanylate cyclase [Clostridiales bacterium]|nr:diguanylate cyclase [Clostridiales bacterium]